MKTDNIIIGIATMPSRQNGLQKVIDSLINQCSELHIYFNEFGGILPDYLKEYPEKLKIFESEKEIGNLYDFSGFYKSIEHKGYFISCDDDIIYPNYFVKNIVIGCQNYDNKAIVGYHGRIYPYEKLKTYYHGYSKLLHINKQLNKDTFVHVVAGCAMCFHTDTFNIDVKQVNIKDYPRMKDIHIAIRAQKLNVPCIVLSHSGHEFINIEVNDSIHRTEHRTDTKQTELFNSINWSLNEYHTKKIQVDTQNQKLWFLTNKGIYKYTERRNFEKFVKRGYVKIVDEKDVPDYIILQQKGTLNKKDKPQPLFYKENKFEVETIISNIQ